MKKRLEEEKNIDICLKKIKNILYKYNCEIDSDWNAPIWISDNDTKETKILS